MSESVHKNIGIPLLKNGNGSRRGLRFPCPAAATMTTGTAMNADDTRHPGNECPDSAAKLSREFNRCLGCRAKPCEKACPLGVSPHDFIAAAKTGDFAAAAAAIAARNPLPQTCGLVCPDRFCQKACIRGRIDTPIEIPCLQAAVMQKGGLPALELPPTAHTAAGVPYRAAVIGGGPAGLGALYEFLLRGWQVDLYEKSAVLGGAARLIPERRLPRTVLETEIARLVENPRVTVRLNTEITDFSALSARYDAVVAALGEPLPRTLGIKGEELCLPYAEYLTSPSRYLCNKAAVVGGGEVALDCALTLREHGCETVEMFVRRRREDMRIMARDHLELEQKGVIVRALTSVAAICPVGNACRLTAVSNQIDSRGRAVACNGTECTLEGYDRVIMALGSFFPADKLPPNTTVAGDMTGNCGTVVQALASGRAAAETAALSAISATTTASTPQNGNISASVSPAASTKEKQP